MTSARVERSTGVMRDRASFVKYGALVAIIGLIALVIGVFVNPRRALTAYLFAYMTVLTVVLGAMVQVMLSHVTGARWFAVLRHLTMPIVAAMPALALLAVPILIGAGIIYPWATPSLLAPDVRELVLRKAAWLNIPWFVGRGIVYLVVWLVVSYLLRSVSDARNRVDAATAVALTRRLRRISALGLVAMAVTITFAAFDWIMSLEPAWYSTIYGAYVFAGGFLAALGLIAVMSWLASQASPPIDDAISAGQTSALGKLMLTFVILWAYIAFSQYLIIWIGDLPSDVSWYVVRSQGSWGIIALVILVGQFAIPFVLLLSRPLKRHRRIVAAIGAWLLAVHLVDVYWLVLPALRPLGISPSWLDIAAVLVCGGFVTAAAAYRVGSRAPLPVGDPFLEPAITYADQ